jgi:hypothetical protein
MQHTEAHEFAISLLRVIQSAGIELDRSCTDETIC